MQTAGSRKPKRGLTNGIHHFGREWPGTGTDIEDACPCGQSACGLVDSRFVDPDCPEHALMAGKTMRSFHWEEDCDGGSGLSTVGGVPV